MGVGHGRRLWAESVLVAHIYKLGKITFIYNVGSNFSYNYTAPIERLVRPCPTAPRPCPCPSPCLRPTAETYAHALHPLLMPLSYAHAPAHATTMAFAHAFNPCATAIAPPCGSGLGVGAGVGRGPGFGLRKRRVMNNIYLYINIKNI